jgi:predicted RNase H-like nuclease
MVLVAGVDGCQRGWIVAAAQAVFPLGPPEINLAPDFGAVLAGPSEIICIDVPIGLADRPQERGCDLQARHWLPKGRKSSVFRAPCRTLIATIQAQGQLPSHADCNAISKRITGKGIPKQAQEISRKIAEVDHLMTPVLQNRVREVHPELCFQALSPEGVKSGKLTSAGREERVVALQPFFPGVDLLALPRPAGVGRDDLLDALVALVTAAKVSEGSVRILQSEEPTPDRKGLRMEMVVPRIGKAEQS